MDGCDFALEEYVSTCLPEMEVASYYHVGHFVAAGAQFFASNFVDECLTDDSVNATQHSTALYNGHQNGKRIGVQCCKEGGGKITAIRECEMMVNFAEASQTCVRNGHRLCTLDEVRTNVGVGKGCSFDSSMVWTSTKCLANRHTTATSKINVVGTPSSGSFDGVGPDSTAMGILMVLAVCLLLLCVANLWRMGRSGAALPNPKYAKVRYADSEDFTENEAKAMNAL